MMSETAFVDVNMLLGQPAHPSLLQLADLLVEHGWCQGRYEDEQGRLCVMGAFYRLLERDETWVLDDCWEAPYYLGLHALERSIADEFGFPEGELCDVSDWNDMEGLTEFEVVSRLRRVGWFGA